jgi:predicted MPP superfamily phosphohydrolase
VGVDDPWTGHDDLDGAFLAPAPRGLPTLGLVHSPGAALPMHRRGAWGVVCGHTHGGHFDLGPLTTWLLGREAAGGAWASVAGRWAPSPAEPDGPVPIAPWLYVNAGLGGAAIPWRLGARSRPTAATLVLHPSP